MSRDEFVRMLVAESIPLHDDFLDATFPERDSTIVRLHSPTHRRFELQWLIEGLMDAGLRDLPDGVLDTPKDPRWAAAVPAAPGRGQWHETATPPGLLFPTPVKVKERTLFIEP